jgi:hypothetical protein
MASCDNVNERNTDDVSWHCVEQLGTGDDVVGPKNGAVGIIDIPANGRTESHSLYEKLIGHFVAIDAE